MSIFPTPLRSTTQIRYLRTRIKNTHHGYGLLPMARSVFLENTLTRPIRGMLTVSSLIAQPLIFARGGGWLTILCQHSSPITPYGATALPASTRSPHRYDRESAALYSSATIITSQDNQSCQTENQHLGLKIQLHQQPRINPYHLKYIQDIGYALPVSSLAHPVLPGQHRCHLRCNTGILKDLSNFPPCYHAVIHPIPSQNIICLHRDL